MIVQQRRGLRDVSALAKLVPAQIKPSGFVVRFALMAAALLLLAPAVLSDFRLSLLAKFLCFAIIALGIGLAWGQGGMLVLGQGLFFGLGGYCMGMHMKIVDAGPGNLPDILTYSGKYETLPWLWKPFASAWFAVPMAILLPMAIAALLGAAIFRQRIRGAYFAILSQALAGAFVIVIVGNLSLTGGTNGLTNFQSFFGLSVDDPADQRILYFIVAIVLLLVFLATRSLVLARYGRLLIASRDDEDRVRFLGYDPARIKLVAYVLAAGMAGLAGALFVPVVGIISPALLGIVPSIEMVIWVALGGRTVLAWAAAGAVIVNWAKTSISEQFPSGWLYLQGLLFVVVILFLPKGIAGARRARERVHRPRVPLRRRAARPRRRGAATVDDDVRSDALARRRSRDAKPKEVAMSKALLEIRDLVVAFEAFHAIDGLDLTLHEHEVRFVIGPNGAGKTTLIDSITNLVRPTSGSIMFAGEELVGRKEHEIVRAGIGRTFQKPSVFDELTVLENVDIAATFRLPFRSLLRRRKGISDEVAEALDVGEPPRAARRPRGLAVARPEAVAGGRDGARPEAAAAAARRAGRRHDREGAPAHRRAHHADRERGHDGARHRARHGLRAPLRAQGDGHARGQDPHRGDGRRGAAATRPCARSTSAARATRAAPRRCSHDRCATCR